VALDEESKFANASDDDVDWAEIYKNYEFNPIDPPQGHFAFAIIDSSFVSMSSSMMSDPDEPKGWKQVAEHPECAQWRQATKEEAENFFKRGVWKKMSLKDLPQGRRPIGTKWVYKKKIKPNHTF